MTVVEGGKPCLVVFPASTGINPGTRFVDRPSYPGIADDYAHTFTVLASLQPDFFLASHTGAFRMDEKRALLKAGANPHPFVDPPGFRAHVAARRRAFDAQLAREKAEQAQTKP